ncbi:MAG: hypothetical protein WCZ90_15515 [Melioribacteraceae bacterium]
MSQVTVRTIHTKKEIKSFIKFAWNIYKDNPYWVAPLIFDKMRILDIENHPFYKHASAEFFIAEKDGVMVGRIAAIKNDLHNQVHEDKAGFWGFFECINDQNVANMLFDAAKDWLKKNGCDEMLGPANPSSNEEYGMLLEGFDDEPRLMMTYNPQYYLDLCDNYGFTKAKDLYAYKLENQKVVGSEKLKRVAEIAQKRSGLKIYSMNVKEFKKELDKVKFVYNKAWEKNWGFVPMTEDEIDALAKDLKPLVEPSLVLFGEIDNQLVGFALVMLDYNQIFKSFNGRLLPFNFLKIFTQKKKISWSRILTLGIIPEYQKRGLDAVFYWEIVNRAANVGILLGEASWILEDNAMMNRGAEVMNGTIYKKYRIYRKSIQ